MTSLRWIAKVPLVALLLLAAPQPADAFCGFYVSGAETKLFNNATMVVMMRDGMRTVLSMQNDYQGPPNDFAMVVPVPVILKKEHVKTLDKAVFDKVDKMAAPRLVEYWEQDPCWIEPPEESAEFEDDGAADRDEMPTSKSEKAFVKVEAKFAVGEYQIVILNSNDAGALDGWLRKNKYNIPKGAKEVLGPYIAQGMYFFVARVDAKKVKFEGNKALLSPLRFHYDTKDFSLPVRLGMLNAQGPQDLIVHILARGQRYEVANMPNATIPTNIDVADDVRKDFGAFYAALFDKTVAKNKNAVITEYSWDASTCDPCPGPTLVGQDFLTLGADVLKGTPRHGFVLTRLHARYTKDSLGEDLVFKAAPPIVGGREVYLDKNELEQGAKPARRNNFQARYAIRHVWEGKITCDNPVRGRWGGPPSGKQQPTMAARNTAFAKRDAFTLEDISRRDIPEIGVTAKTTTRKLMEKPAEAATKEEATKKGEPVKKEDKAAAKEGNEDPGGCSTAPGNLTPLRALVVVLLGLLLAVRR